jgi:hypothetical protein
MLRLRIALIGMISGLAAACSAAPPELEPAEVGEHEAAADAIEAPPPAAAPVNLAEEPPPRSEEVQARPFETVERDVEAAQRARDARALRVLRGSRARAGAGRVVAARGRVAEVKAFDRPLPAALGWGADVRIATRIEIEVDEMLCGASSRTLTAWYAGGVLPDGRGVRTSQMTRDLAIGDERVFWLEDLDGELFLTAGRGSTLRPVDRETYETEDRATVRRAELKGVCQ